MKNLLLATLNLEPVLFQEVTTGGALIPYRFLELLYIGSELFSSLLKLMDCLIVVQLLLMH